MTSRVVLATLIGASLLVAAVGCRPAETQKSGTRATNGTPGSSASPERTPVQVTTAPVEVRAVQRTIEVTGTLFGQEEATISSKLSGRVAEIFTDVGDEVAPGAPLAQIEQQDYQLEIDQRRTAMLAALARIGLSEDPGADFDASKVPTVVRARAEEANAKAKYERAQKLFAQNPPLISAQDFADIRTAWEVASGGAEVEMLTSRAALAEARTRAAELAAAEQRLADTTLRAPPAPLTASSQAPRRYFVSMRMVSAGEYVTEGRPVFALVDSDTVKFRADVPERYARQVVPGQSAAVKIEAYPDAAPGTVARVAPRIDPQSRTFQIEVTVPNASGKLKPGAFARGSIATRVEEGVKFVPKDAVVTFAGVRKVFGIRGGKAVEHRIQIGSSEGDLVEVIGEFNEDRVVTDGAAALSDGAPITQR